MEDWCTNCKHLIESGIVLQAGSYHPDEDIVEKRKQIGVGLKPL
jgi:hypothetical protein